MEVSVCLDRKMFRKKPEGKDIKELSVKIASERVSVDIKELADYVGNRGRTFCPAIFAGGQRLADRFEQMQLFVLDFDGGISYEEIKEIADGFELPISFSYYTFSSEEDNPKFRIVFMHGGVVRNRDIAEMMLAMLKKLFPQSDKSCFETSRLFFGGKGIIEVDENAAFRIDKLAYYYQMELSIHCKNQYSRDIKTFAGKYHIDLLDKNMLHICACENGDFAAGSEDLQKIVEKKVSSNIIYIELPFFSTKIKIVQCNGKEKEEKKLGHHNHMRNTSKADNIDFQEIKVKCRLFEEFIKGTPLHHDERFLLATNIIHIKDMKKVFLTITKKFYESWDKWEFSLKYIEAMGYYPQGCDGHCPYTDRCVHDTNICLTLKGRKNITKVGREQFVPVEEAYNELERCFMEAYQSDDRGLHIIRAQTSIGKTELYSRVLNNEDRLTIVAVPTVKLKHEVMGRINSGKTVEALSLQDICLEKACEMEIKDLYDRGLYREARECLRKYEDALEDEGHKGLIRQFRSLNEIIRKKEKMLL